MGAFTCDMRRRNNGLRVLQWVVACLCCLIVTLISILIWLVISHSGTMNGVHVHQNCWIPEGRDACAPQFIVAGAMKSGTTSLWAYLLNHPLVLPLQKTVIDPQKKRTVLAEKEVRFFNDPAYSQLIKEYGKKQAINFYLDLFYPIPPAPSQGGKQASNYGKITGEASPMYICTPGVARRIYQALPEVKIIIMLRDPID